MDPPSPEPWQEIERLLDSALDLPSERRAGFLEEASAGDEGLRDAVAKLLEAAEEPDSRLDGAAVDFAAHLLSASSPQAAADGPYARVGPPLRPLLES